MKQLVSSLSYFSIFFAPFLFPIIVWIVARDEYIAGHAKRALFSHVFPFLAAIPLFYFFVTVQSLGSAVGFVTLFFVIYGLSFVYNVVKGIQVLREYY